jgi:hypothetical protein
VTAVLTLIPEQPTFTTSPERQVWERLRDVRLALRVGLAVRHAEPH